MLPRIMKLPYLIHSQQFYKYLKEKKGLSEPGYEAKD